MKLWRSVLNCTCVVCFIACDVMCVPVCLHVCVVRLSPTLRVVSPRSTSRLTMATLTWPRFSWTEGLLWTSWLGWVYSALCCLGGVLPTFKVNNNQGVYRLMLHTCWNDYPKQWFSLVSMTLYWASGHCTPSFSGSLQTKAIYER